MVLGNLGSEVLFFEIGMVHHIQSDPLACQLPPAGATFTRDFPKTVATDLIITRETIRLVI